MRHLLLLLSAFLIIPSAAMANERGQDNWLFSEKPLYLTQLANACSMLNEHQGTASCYPTNGGVVITAHVPISNINAEQETAALRYQIVDIQLMAAHSDQHVLMIDKSKKPYMAGKYVLPYHPDVMDIRMIQESYSSLEEHCNEYKITPWYCTKDKPDTSWLEK